jgi:hypothetical protein
VPAPTVLQQVVQQLKHVSLRQHRLRRIAAINLLHHTRIDGRLNPIREGLERLVKIFDSGLLHQLHPDDTPHPIQECLASATPNRCAG